MSYVDALSEEETLQTYFDRSKFTVGGDTSQLKAACSVVQQFIAQELWCVRAAGASSLLGCNWTWFTSAWVVRKDD